MVIVHGYDRARVCQNGHLLANELLQRPQPPMPFCPKCGADTMEKCPNCDEQLNGYYKDPNNAVFHHSDVVDAFCPFCGVAYPWTAHAQRAAEELAEMLDMLSEEDRHALAEAIGDLVCDTPSSITAAYQFKVILAKATVVAGGQVLDAFKNILYGVVSAKVGALIWP